MCAGLLVETGAEFLVGLEDVWNALRWVETRNLDDVVTVRVIKLSPGRDVSWRL